MNTHAQSYWQRRFAVDKNLLEELRFRLLRISETL